MVALVRRGSSQRAVARRFGVALRTVQRWIKRAGGRTLPEADWRSRSKRAHHIANKTSAEWERQVCVVRQQLERTGALGFVGAQAIHDALREAAAGGGLPSVRTMGRILRRQGLLDGQRRVRRAAPPPGWYLPALAQQQAELDSFDVVEDLRMENLGLFQLVTTRALWGTLAEAWPAQVASTSFILQALQAHWQRQGLPTFAQFDNDVRFQGGHNHPDVIGRVMRFCLALGVTPVFVPPLETGFQAVIENFNGLWQQKVWARFHHENLAALSAASQRFTHAYRQHLARRHDPGPPRRPFPKDWNMDWQRPPRGTLIYLRRREPADQPLIKTLGYQLPARRFDTRPRHHHPLTPIP